MDEEQDTFATSLIQGMTEALAFANGEATDAIVHIPDDINVRRIRKKLQMSQATFAAAFGFPVRTLQEWEQGRRMPSGAAKNFLYVIDQEPEAVSRVLRPS